MIAPENKPSVSTVATAGLGAPAGVIAVYVVNELLAIAGRQALPETVALAVSALVAAAVGYFFLGGRKGDTDE